MTSRAKARVAVVTHSAACVPANLARELDICVAPLQLIWEDRVYRDGKDMTPTEFYRRFRQGTTRPTTTQPTLGDFVDIYSRLARRAEAIVSIHVAERLSTTLEVARLAAQEVPSVPIRVVDACTGATAQGFVALAAARAARAGGSLAEVVSVAEACRERVGLYLALETLEHLHRGGRIGQAATLLGSRLGILPILYLADQEVRVAGVARRRGRAKERVLELTASRVGSSAIRASVFHADAEEEALAMGQRVRERLRCLEFFISEFTPVMGAHTGPGVIGVAFCIEEEET